MKTNSLTVSSDREYVTITICNPFKWNNLTKFYVRILSFLLASASLTIQDAKFIIRSFVFIVCLWGVVCCCLPFLIYVFQ